MKHLRIMKKILVILVLFVLLFTNCIPVYASDSKPAFYYSGTQKGTYNARSSIFAAITKFLADIADYLIGLATLGHRMFLVGWTSIAEVALNETLEAAAGEETEFILDAAVLDMSNSDEQRRVTVENIVFNKIPLLDANFFNTEIDDTVTGTGIVREQIEEENSTKDDSVKRKDKNVTVTGLEPGAEETDLTADSSGTNPASDENVITIIKGTIAKWYYAMRSVAVGCMLLILLYIALRLIVATMGEEKAKYKQMLYNWVIGFAVVFCIHYIMLFVFMINEELVGIFNKMSVEYVEQEYKSANDKTNTEMELSLYSNLRSRAYELKASRGWVGTILYMVLVYYAVRFTLVYLKRYFTIMILAMMAPVLSATYAFGKVRTGKAESFNKWLKEFVFAVLLQSVHAMLYVTLITQLLRLTETSLIGVILSFMILNFMLKADGIVKRIFNMSTGQHGSLDNIMNSASSFAESVVGLKAGADIAKAYGKYWLKPVYGAMGKVAGAGLNVAGSTLLGAAGGTMQFLDERRIAKTFDSDAGARGDKREKDKDGNPIESDKEKKKREKREKYNKDNIFGVDPISGDFNQNYISQRLANSAFGQKLSNSNIGKKFVEGTGKKADIARAKLYASAGIVMGDINKDDISLLGGNNKQIQKLEEARKKYIRQQQKEQIKKLMSVTAGMAMTTLAVPMMVAHPKMGITLLAQGHAMKQSVAKYDKKGEINKRSFGIVGYKDENGKRKYKVQGLMTSAGTYVKKATGIAFIEGLTTNISDDIAKVKKQEGKFASEFEKLYDTRDKLLDIELDKQQRIIEQQQFLLDPQQAMRIEKAKDGIAAGTYGVYNGRLMEANPALAKFMQENGIQGPEGAIAMNMMMTIALKKDVGVEGGSFEAAIRGFEHNDSMNPAIYSQMREIQKALDANPQQADQLVRIFAIQNATAAALDTKEMTVTAALEDAGVMTSLENKQNLDAQFGAQREEKYQILASEFGDDPTQFSAKLEEMKATLDKMEETRKIQEAMLDVDAFGEGEYEYSPEEIAQMTMDLDRLEQDKKALEEKYNALNEANEQYTNINNMYGSRVGDVHQKVKDVLEAQGVFETATIKQQTEVLEQKQQVFEEVKAVVQEKQDIVTQREEVKQEKVQEVEKLDDEVSKMKAAIETQEKMIEAEESDLDTTYSPEEIEYARQSVEQQKWELEQKEKELNEAKTKLEEAEKALEQATNDLNEQKQNLDKAEKDVKEVETKIEEVKDKMVERAIEDCESINGDSKTRIDIEDSSMLGDEELLAGLKESGGYEALLEMERRDKPEECQKLETVLLDVAGEGSLAEVQVQVEDLEAREQDIKDLVAEIRGETVEVKDENGNIVEKSVISESVMIERSGETDADGNPTITPESFDEELRERRQYEETRDVVGEIADELQRVIDESASKSEVENIIREREEQGKTVEISEMTDDELIAIRREQAGEEHDYMEKVRRAPTDTVTVSEQEIAKTKAKDKIKEASPEDQAVLAILLDKLGSSDLSVQEFNKIVKEINSVNAAAEEAFVTEMRDPESESNKRHSSDYMETNEDKLRRGLNSEAVRSTRERTITEIRAAEIIMENDYAQYEPVTARSSSNSGKKLEKGPLGNLSFIIKNLE